MFKYVVLFYLAIIFIVVFACAPKAPVETALVKEESQTAITSAAREGLNAEWEKTVDAAKKEEKVVVYSTLLTEMLRDISPMFKSKYGLAIDITGGRGTEFRAKLLTEQKNGIFWTDIAISGLNTIFSIKEAGATEPLVPNLIWPEVTDPKVYYGGEIPFADKDRRIFRTMAYPTHSYLINNELVKPEDIKSFYDLLNPRFKGKIVMSDPMVTGSAFNLFSTLLYRQIMNLDFFRQLAKQEPVLTRDLRLEVEWLARGKYSIDWGAQNAPIQEFKRQGAPLTLLVAKEGTYLSASAGNLILVKQSPHPNAARVFINWLLSREGQIMEQKYMGSHSSRADIPTEGVEPNQIRKAGDKYFMGASETEGWVVNEQDKYLALAREIFGPLTR